MDRKLMDARDRWWRRALAASAAVAIVLPASASAQVQPAGTGEPAFTNSAQNTQWFEWPAQSAGMDAYQVQYSYYENNVVKASPTVNYGTAAGSTWANWSGVATLQQGAQYGICAQGRYSFTNDPLFYPDGPNSCSMGTTLGRRSHTTIDRSKPTAALELAAGAAFVRDAKVPLGIDFADDVAGPFPATFLCMQAGGGPAGVCDTGSGATYSYTAACSVPGGPGRSTTFSCTADFGPGPDGTVWACAIAADASIPDNPTGSNQTGTADKANLSPASCDGVVLDRTPPTVSIGMASGTVAVGDVVAFQASASDATSGLAGVGRWTWGDGSAAASGDAVTHSYAAPGTYEVTLTSTDAAGNVATAKRSITVTAPAATDPPPAVGSGTPPPTRTDGAAQPASLALGAPRKVRVRSRVIPVKLTGSAAGRVQLVLRRAGRVVARAGVTLRAARTATHRLKLPKRIKAGRYKLRATYRPAAGRAISRSRTITLMGKPSARRATAARAGTRGPVAVGRGPRALPDGRFHGPRPARTFEVRLAVRDQRRRSMPSRMSSRPEANS
jgi:plastocyanin